MNRILPSLILFFTLAAACVIFPATIGVRMSEEAGVAAKLPDTVGEWQGETMVFCSNPRCTGETFTLEPGGPCPRCGDVLQLMSPDERRLLPADTVLVRRRYRHPTSSPITVSVVFSGRHRSSIHRPEVCLVGQGSEIVASRVYDVALEGRAPLRLKVLDLLHHRAGERPVGTYFAYCFVGPRRETPSHYARMFWMAWERIFRSTTSRWAYVALSGRRPVAGEAHLRELDGFVAGLYPLIAPTP